MQQTRAGALVMAALAAYGCAQAPPVVSQVPSGVVPAKLAVTAPDGAAIQLDGVLVGNAPLGSAISADPGPHEVAVGLDGHAPVLRRVELVRGKTRALEIELETTAQRKAAWSLIAIGGAGIATGIVLGALAVVEQRKADDLARGGSFGVLDAQRFDEFTLAAEARDRYRVGSGVAAAAGAASFVTGALLYAFDEAVLPAGGHGERAGVLLSPTFDPLAPGLVTTFHGQW